MKIEAFFSNKITFSVIDQNLFPIENKRRVTRSTVLLWIIVVVLEHTLVPFVENFLLRIKMGATKNPVRSGYTFL